MIENKKNGMNRKTKILEVISSLSTGGAEKLVVDIVPRLRADGFDVDVCLFNGAKSPFYNQLAQCGCKIYSFSDGGNVYNPMHIFRLRKLMKDYDIIHTHNTAPQLFAAIGSMLCSVVLVTTEHSTANRRRDWLCYKSIDRWMYNRYKTIICISDQAEINLRKHLRSIKTRIVTIYNGVDVLYFKCAKPSVLLKSTSRFVFVMVAGFRYQKDQDTLIKAMALLPKDEYELWLVGDGERRHSLEVLSKELGVEDNVRFWGVRSDIPEILHSADVVVMSSHFEGLSLSSIEGMSVDKPFVASDVDGLREITKSGAAGILFPHGNEKALKEILKKLKEDKQYYQEVAGACWSRAQEYDICKTVEEYAKLYREVQ